MVSNIFQKVYIANKWVIIWLGASNEEWLSLEGRIEKFQYSRLLPAQWLLGYLGKILQILVSLVCNEKKAID